MRLTIAALIGTSFAICFVLTLIIKRIAPRFGFVDKPGGRKIHANPKPLGGGVAIYWGIALPMLAMLAVLDLAGENLVLRYQDQPYIVALITGAQHQTPLSLGLLGAMLALHALGLID